MTVYDGQLIVLNQDRTLKVWNNYSAASSYGPDPDYIIDPYQGSGIGPNDVAMMSSAVDAQGRLWLFDDQRQLRVFQLPFTQNNQPPIAADVPLYWVNAGVQSAIKFPQAQSAESQAQLLANPDDIEQVGVGDRLSVAFDNAHHKMYVVDEANGRILRVSNYDNPSYGLQVDMVLGQPSMTASGCADSWGNQGQPTATTLCRPLQVTFDHQGNMYIVDNDYECHGNIRIDIYRQQTLAAAMGMFPNLAVDKVLIAPNATSRGVCRQDPAALVQPGSPISVAFTNMDQMVVANDGYYGDSAATGWGYLQDSALRPFRQLWFYENPLQETLPDGYIDLPLGSPGELAIDPSGDLLVQDHTWNRVWGINPSLDPSWLSCTGNTGCVWGNYGASGTPTTTATATSTGTPSSTAAVTPTATASATPTATAGGGVPAVATGVAVSDLGPTGFALTFTTSASTAATLAYGTGAGALGSVAYDNRDGSGPAGTASTVHRFTLRQLTAGTTYYFEPVIGGVAQPGPGGAAYSQTVPNLSGAPSFAAQVLGSVLLQDGTWPLSGTALLTGYWTNLNGAQSAPLSVLNSSEVASGSYNYLFGTSIPLTQDGSAYFPLDSKSVFHVSGAGDQSGQLGCGGPVSAGLNSPFTTLPSFRLGPVVSVTYTVQRGWNLLSLPLSPTTPISASTLLAGLLAQTGGSYAEIDGFTNGAWAPSYFQEVRPTPLTGGSDYTLVLGQGYALYSDTAGSIGFSGLPATAQAVSLASGWNLVGFPDAYGSANPARASAILSGLLAQTHGNYAELDGFGEGHWTPSCFEEISPSVTRPNDYSVTAGQGYMLYTDAAASRTL